MDTDKLANFYHRIVASVLSANDLGRCWAEVVAITGVAGNPALAGADIDADVQSIVLQLTSAIRAEPIPSKVNILWFGLFDERLGDKELAGYYFAGWANDGEIQEGGPPPYFPAKRYLTSTLLNMVKDESCKFGGEDDEFSVLDYAVMFGAAATLSKFVAQSAGIQLPVYVGFDSGDFACVNR